jgi:hypothetical protein
MMDPRVWIRTPRSLCEGPNILYQDTICMKSAFSVCRFPRFCLFGFGAFSGLSGPPGSLARAGQEVLPRSAQEASPNLNKLMLISDFRVSMSRPEGHSELRPDWLDVGCGGVDAVCLLLWGLRGYRGQLPEHVRLGSASGRYSAACPLRAQRRGVRGARLLGEEACAATSPCYGGCRAAA